MKAGTGTGQYLKFELPSRPPPARFLPPTAGHAPAPTQPPTYTCHMVDFHTARFSSFVEHSNVSNRRNLKVTNIQHCSHSKFVTRSSNSQFFIVKNVANCEVAPNQAMHPLADGEEAQVSPMAGVLPQSQTGQSFCEPS